MTRIAPFAAAVVLAAIQVPAVAQKAPPAAPTLTQEQKNHAVQTFQLIAAAMESDKVPNDVKSALMGCMYDNSMGRISETVDNALNANPGKVDRAKPDQMIGVIATICGYRPPQGAGAAPPKAAPAPAAPAKGR